MTNFRFLLKHAATVVACFTAVFMFSSCDLLEPTDKLGKEAVFETFTFAGIEGVANISESSSTIAAKASAATNLASIAPAFVVSKGATVQVNGVTQTSGATVNNFTNAVTYTVISEDEKTTKHWTVSITKDGKTPPVAGADANFEFFSFTGMEGTANINPNAPTITAKASAATNLASIAPTFALSNGAKATVNGQVQTSGVTAHNFTNPVTYTVVSEDAQNTKTWTVTITKDGDGGDDGGDGGDGGDDGGDGGDDGGDGGDDGGYGGNGNEPGYTKGAVKYKFMTDGVMTGEVANTFDFGRGFYRMDNWTDGMHMIVITDLNNKLVHMYMLNNWTTMPYTDGSGSNDDNIYDEDVAIIQRLPNRTFAGKVCDTWRITLKDGSAEYIQSFWQGILMYLEPVYPKGTIMEATSVTLDFPDSAFSQSSIEVTWL